MQQGNKLLVRRPPSFTCGHVTRDEVRRSVKIPKLKIEFKGQGSNIRIAHATTLSKSRHNHRWWLKTSGIGHGSPYNYYILNELLKVKIVSCKTLRSRSSLFNLFKPSTSAAYLIHTSLHVCGVLYILRYFENKAIMNNYRTESRLIFSFGLLSLFFFSIC